MNFFEKYGPSARDCYNFCKANALSQYDSLVRRKVKEMRWDSIIGTLTSQPGDVEMDEDSHRILLVEPQSNDRAVSRARVVRQTVSQLLWERDSDEQWRNHHKLFKTLYQEASAKGLCGGTLFEPAFHALCVRGATFTIYLMDCRGKPGNYILTNNQPRNSIRVLHTRPTRAVLL